MGDIEVPRDALWRAQTQRAVENFPISGTTLEPSHVVAIARVKKAAARINAELGIITDERAQAIAAGADEIIGGQHHDAFPIDVFQTGSGTSSNMNMNEVLASLSAKAGVEVHPNDHVNASQSSNDTFPTSIHVAAVEATTSDLVPALDHLAQRARGEGRGVQGRREVRPDAPDGRHPGDARPGVRWVRRDRAAGHRAARVDAPPRGRAPPRRHRGRHRHQHPDGFAEKVIADLADETGLPFTEARNHFEAQGGQDALVELSGQLRTIAVGPDQDLQRPALDVLGTDDRALRDPPARPAARVEHHARQGQPGAAGGDADGVRPGRRQRRDRRRWPGRAAASSST